MMNNNFDNKKLEKFINNKNVIDNLKTISMIQYNGNLYKLPDLLDIVLLEEMKSISFSTKDIDVSCRLDRSNYVFVCIMRTPAGEISSVEKFPKKMIKELYDIVLSYFINKYNTIDDMKDAYKKYCKKFKKKHNL